MEIYLATRNEGKLMAARSVFDRYGIKIKSVEKKYPEIQADSSSEVARYTALQAVKDLNSPVIREDHALFINALGIPGPYMNYFEKRVSAETILKIIGNFNDRAGYFEVATVYAEPGGLTKEYVFRVPFTFAQEERGRFQTGWNGIIMLQGEKRTLAEYPEGERTEIWNRNYLAIAEYIRNSGSST
mgnify:CR=1 FL=1